MRKSGQTVAPQPGEAFPKDSDRSRVTFELLYAGSRTRVFRAQMPGHAATLIAKEPRGPDAVKRLQHERAMLERAAGLPGVPRLAPDRLAGMLVIEDVGGVTLASVLRHGRPPPPVGLRIALQLTQTVAAIHRAGFVHHDVNPTNVVLAGADRRPWLIDFDIATAFAEGRPGFIHPNEVTGTLPYLAPEQTGRTGRAVDQRADLYALGATLYELFTGQPPFADDDPLDLIRAHLARVPVAPHVLDPELAPALSAIILRLLEKEPDRRYQSAEGLAHDLTRVCDGECQPFPLGVRDFPLRLVAPSRLIGRDAEIHALETAFAAALAGPRRGLLIAGAPGVGKSALVDELRPLVTARGGWLIAGKFDQYRHEGASATAQALRALGRLLLAEPEVQLRTERERILQALGANAGLLAELIPEFANLLGTQPAVRSSDPVEAEVRLRQTALSLLGAVASPARPIVLVLDDLQWAGAVSLRLIDDTLLDPSLRGLLLVGAYRDGEVDAAHPLSGLLSRWERLDHAPTCLPLSNLPDDELATFLAQMLRLSPADATALASAIGARTHGNPYDTVELVNALRREGALSLTESGWSWDPATIRRFVGRGEVIELICARIARLPQETQTLLETHACLGADVTLTMLRAASGLGADALEAQVGPALEDGLLVLRQGAEPTVSFRHDRVQQAAYGGLSPARCRALHLAIARRLASEPWFVAEAGAQYLAAVEAVEEAAERRSVVGLFRQAADRARLSSNWAAAERFLSAARGLLSPIAGAADDPLVLALECEQHVALYALGRLDEADRLFEAIEEHCREPLDMVDPACAQIASLTIRGRPHEAVPLGLRILRRLGLKVPEGELGPQIAGWLDETRDWVEAHADLDESQRPEPHDPVVLATYVVLNRTLAPAYFCDHAMMVWLVSEAQRLWSKHGPSERGLGPLSQSCITLVLRGDFRTGYRGARHAVLVGEARHFMPGGAMARFLFATCATHWFERLESGLEHATRAREELLRAGELQAACYSFYATLPAQLDCAPSLELWADELAAAFALTARTGSEYGTLTYLGHRQLLRALRGETSEPGSFTDASFDEAAHLSGVGGMGMAGALYHIHRALGAALFGHGDALIEHAARALPLLPFILGSYPNALAHMLSALALAERARAATGDDARAALAELDVRRDWLALRAADAPSNFLHLSHLVEAERAFAAGEFRTAISAFDAALREAAQRPRRWHHALIAERAARFHFAMGLIHSGRALLAEARAVYESWGARAKVQDLEHQHGFLRGAAMVHDPRQRQTRTLSSDAIDMMAILRASQALSSETDLAKLKDRVEEVLGALTGATSVRIALWREPPGGWFLTSAGADDSANAETAALSVEEAGARGLLPLSAFRYAERTREALLVEDALHDDRFARDPYLSGLERCSLLIVPVLRKGVPQALLVLENRLSGGAFSADRLSAVMLIVGQLAISLENALLYGELEQRVAERTRELRETQADLVTTARRAGMAEIATNVLHNVGNVLNSVNISAGLLRERIRGSKLTGLNRALELMHQHGADLSQFLNHDARGKQLLPYLDKLAGSLTVEQQSNLSELEQLTGRIDHIKDIVATQQSYAGSSGMVESASISDLIEDALRIHAGALVRNEVAIAREFPELRPLPLDRHRVLQILVNLISNANHALCGVTDRPRSLTLRVTTPDESTLRVQVIDNGTGIRKDDLIRIFAHGFTTRQGGRGFGLHSCVLAAKQMGGSLTADSDGPGCGATFTLELPVLRGA